MVVVLLQYRHYLFCAEKSYLMKFFKKHIIFTDFISKIILGQFFSNCFSVSDFISFITVFFTYYRRFFYSGKKTPHYRYRFWKITLLVFLKIWRITIDDVSSKYNVSILLVKRPPHQKYKKIYVMRGWCYLKNTRGVDNEL